jgi:hypothetical protein
MSYKIVTNQKGSTVLVRMWANTDLPVANLTVNSSIETVSSAHLTKIWCGASAAGEVRVARGANTTDANNVVLILPGADQQYIDFAGTGVTIDYDKQTANIVFTATSNTVAYLEFRKTSTFTSEY